MKLLVSSKNIVIHATTLFLLLIGIVAIFSSTYTAKTISEGQGTINKQLIFIIIGVTVYLILGKSDYNFLRYPIIFVPIYTLLIALLVYVLYFTDEIRGTNRWISLGFINIQPSEYAKIILISVNAIVFKLSKSTLLNAAGKISAGFASLINMVNIDIMRLAISAIFNLPVIILVFLQPSLGNTLIILFIWLAMYYFTSDNIVKLTAFISSILLGIIVVSRVLDFKQISHLSFEVYLYNINILILLTSLLVMVIFSKLIKVNFLTLFAFFVFGVLIWGTYNFIWENKISNYQKDRIESFINPGEASNQDRWQVTQSKIAIGSGGLFGEGLLQGSQSKLKYLPFAYTDFIFASISEEFGFAGAIFLITVYIVLLLVILYSSSKINEDFGSTILLGLFFMFLIHIFVNIGMNLGILPVTGIPLPLVSYGGSSVMVNLISLGIAQSILSRNEVFDRNNRLVITSESL